MVISLIFKIHLAIGVCVTFWLHAIPYLQSGCYIHLPVDTLIACNPSAPGAMRHPAKSADPFVPACQSARIHIWLHFSHDCVATLVIADACDMLSQVTLAKI